MDPREDVEMKEDEEPSSDSPILETSATNPSPVEVSSAASVGTDAVLTNVEPEKDSVSSGDKTENSSPTGIPSSKVKEPASRTTKEPLFAAPVEDSDLIASVRSSSRPVIDKPEKRRREKAKKSALSKKRKGESSKRSDASQDGYEDEYAPKKPGPKKGKKKKEDGKVRKKKKGDKLTPAQSAVKDMMRQLLEEDKYSVQGSIVDTDSSDDEEDDRAIYATSGGAGGHKRGMYAEEEATLIHLDRSVIARAARKRLRIEGMKGVMDTAGSRKRANSIVIVEDKDSGNPLSPMAASDVLSGDDSSGGRAGRKKKRKKGKRTSRGTDDDVINCNDDVSQPPEGLNVLDSADLGDDIIVADESSIFGQTTGSSNATWVECDKCKKWRRLRGIVDARKLPPKWYCTMNKNDADRARCSAPEEEYEAPVTQETLSDQRARKHLRLWVRRLQCNENYESRLPTMTRGKRRNTTNAKDPYEWVRCCNPSCGKWRAVLRSMDAASVIDGAKNGEWYCVLNTWDEKSASCAAPQENLPAIGCPPWVMQNED